MTEAQDFRSRKIRKQAQDEIEEENFATAVKAMKAKLREGRWWHRVFPYQIIMRKRK